MFIDIEVIAGKILDLLDDKGAMDFFEIKRNINEPAEFINLSLQWLKRTEFITQTALTNQYAINDVKKVYDEEEIMAGSDSKN